METENNFDHEKEGKTGIKEEPFCLETTQLQIESVLSNTSLQKEVVDFPSVSLIEPEHDTHIKMESKINIKEELWCVESTSSVPGFESEETPPSNVHLENGLVYVSCDAATEPQNKNNLDKAIKEEPLWKVRSTESKNGALQNDMKDTDSAVNDQSPKLSTETQRACIETVSNHGTCTSTLSENTDLQENSCLKMKEDGSDCKTSDFAVQLKKNGVQEMNEVHTEIEIKEETWWLDRTSPVKSEPESTLPMDADLQDNTKLSLSLPKKCWNDIKTKCTKDMANETRQFMKTGAELPPSAASTTSELELAVSCLGHNVEFWFDSDTDDMSSSDLSKPAQVIILGSGIADTSSNAQGQTLPSLPQPPLSLSRKCIMRESLMEVELEMRLKKHRLQMECDAKLQSLREKRPRGRWETTRKEEERRQAFEWEEERKRKAFKWEEERKRKAFKWEEERKRKAFEAEERRKEEKRIWELKMRKKANVLMRA